MSLQDSDGSKTGTPAVKPRQDNGCAAAKASFDGIYDAPDPTRYFRALRPLDYRTPQHAQPVIRRALAALARIRRQPRLQVLDLCSGYGVNGALLKHEIGLDHLYRRYAGQVETVSPAADRAALAASRRAGEETLVVGQDVAGRALAYAQAAGYLDGSLCADLEREPLSLRQAEMIAETDLITITGGLSYIGEATLTRVLRTLRRRPWVLFFPLRGAPVEEIEEGLGEAGLWLERWRKPFAHRRYAGPEERRDTLTGIAQLPDDGLGPISQSHQEAVLHLARPEEESDEAPLSALVLGKAAAGREAGLPAFER